MNIIQQLRQKRASSGISYELNGVEVFIDTPPLTRFTSIQAKADLQARRELASMRDELEAEPIDEKAWEDSINQQIEAGVEKDMLPAKPKNRYEQMFEAEKNTAFIFGIAPFMIYDAEGNSVCNSEVERKFLSGEIEKSPSIIPLINKKMQEFGEAAASLGADKKK